LGEEIFSGMPFMGHVAHNKRMIEFN